MKRHLRSSQAFNITVLPLLALLLIAASPMGAASDLVISGAIDGPLTGGTPKAVEFYALNNIADLSAYGFGSANNGGGTDGQEFTFPAAAVAAGSHIYLATESAQFTNFFGFAPDFTSGAVAINGDDALELFHNGAVADVFGDIDVDGTGQPWEHLDGWAYRNIDSGPDCNTFVLGNWSFSGPNALDGETTNAGAAVPFPLGTFTTVRTDSGPCVVSTSPIANGGGVPVDSDITIDFNEAVSATPAAITVSCVAGGAQTGTISGSPSSSIVWDGDVDFSAADLCTVTVVAAEVTDVDTDDPPDNLPGDIVFSFTAAGTGGGSGWVINEIHADPASGLSGDANGDGVRNATQDEFVEIVNNTGSDADISGWTVSDGFGLRHTFPAGTVVSDQCSIVVFGGGTPTGVFGNSEVQTASGGSLGLNNGGDGVFLNDGVSDVATASYGSEGGDNQSLTLDPDITGTPPYVRHTLATGSGGTLYSPGTSINGTQFVGCSVSAEIFEIQGAGLTSPLAGRLVRTTDNVVTALGPDGFFIQTPEFRNDFDPDTSNGIFVFTAVAPTVAVGDLVNVNGTVQEFFEFTEISTTTEITIVGSETVPIAFVFDDVAPSPDPDAPSCAIEFECYEGMLVEIVGGTVTGPNQRFSTDTSAEVHITAASARTFREPGIEDPGIAGLPEWDGNPEVFELDPDKLGLPNEVIPAGSSFDATGVIGFEFGGYELWPSALSFTPAPLPVAVRPRAAGEFTVGTLNLFRLFDDVDDPPDGDRNDAVVSTAEYQRRLTKFSAYVRTVLDAPDILGVQEVESLTVLQDLAGRITLDDPGIVYTASLVEGNDIGTIDVGFLTRAMIQVDAVTQLGKNETFVNPITLQNDILHDRPPLLLEGSCQLEFGAFPIAVMTVHNRSLGGIDGAEGLRVRQKRYEQALSIAQKVQDIQNANPDVHLVVNGDFNAFEFTDGYVDSVNIIRGNFIAADNLVCDTNVCSDTVEPDLANRVLNLTPTERYSFIFRGNAQVLDHALTSSALEPFVSGAFYGRGNADAAVDLINDDTTALRASDHDGLVLYISNDADADGVGDDVDLCLGTVIPEAVPQQGSLGNNRWALTDDADPLVFDQGPPQSGAMFNFTTGDTGGCSCEQIIEELGLGKGHTKNGCSTGAILDWIDTVPF